MSNGITIDTNDEVYSIWSNSNLGGLALSANIVGYTTRYDLFLKHSNGNVGIGTANPSQKLEVAGNTLINNSGDGKLYLGSTSDYIGNIGSDIYMYSSGQNIFYAGGSEQLRIKTNGNVLIPNGSVGIGTTSPGQKLEVDGQVLSDGYRLAAMQTAPATRNSTGTLGEIVIDGNHIYVCYATDSWSRVALETSW
jgi:hypothetical protein